MPVQHVMGFRADCQPAREDEVNQPWALMLRAPGRASSGTVSAGKPESSGSSASRPRREEGGEPAQGRPPPMVLFQNGVAGACRPTPVDPGSIRARALRAARQTGRRYLEGKSNSRVRDRDRARCRCRGQGRGMRPRPRARACRFSITRASPPGMCTRRTGAARCFPDLARLSGDGRFSSSFSPHFPASARLAAAAGGFVQPAEISQETSGEPCTAGRG
jgi:hypothetical protein